MNRRLTDTAEQPAKCGQLDWQEPAFEWSGDGLGSAERGALRSRVAYIALLEHLLADASFRATVTEIRTSEDPKAQAWQRARPYAAIGARRRLIATWLLIAASHPTIESATPGLLNFGVRFVTESEAPGWQVTLALPTGRLIENVEDEGPDVQARRSTYLLGEAFHIPLAHAARCLATKPDKQLSATDERAVRRAVALAMEGVRPDAIGALWENCGKNYSPQ